MTDQPTYEQLLARVTELEEKLKAVQATADSSPSEPFDPTKTTRLSRETELRMEAEAYLRAIWNNTSAGIVIIDEETHEIMDVNPFACDMIGRTKEELVGHVCHNFICPTCVGKCPITDLHQTVDNTERIIRTREGDISVLKTVVPVEIRNRKCLIESFVELTELKRAQRGREMLIQELQDKIAQVKKLSGLLPICSVCKKVRDDNGYWDQIEGYISKRSDLDFSHSICPDCARKLYPEMKIYDD
ncbi:MAG: PAS domain S-box protein [Kiritimatiellia bacterium]